MIHIEGKIRLRKADEDECRLGGMTPEEALEFSISHSTQAFAVEKDGEILAYWGWQTESFLCGGCKAWMLSTPAIEKHWVFAARRSRELLDMLLWDHYAVTVIVDPSYEVSVRWLEWLGFQRIRFVDRFSEMRVTRGSRA